MSFMSLCLKRNICHLCLYVLKEIYVIYVFMSLKKICLYVFKKKYMPLCLLVSLCYLCHQN